MRGDIRRASCAQGFLFRQDLGSFGFQCSYTFWRIASSALFRKQWGWIRAITILLRRTAQKTEFYDHPNRNRETNEIGSRSKSAGEEVDRKFFFATSLEILKQGRNAKEQQQIPRGPVSIMQPPDRAGQPHDKAGKNENRSDGLPAGQLECMRHQTYSHGGKQDQGQDPEIGSPDPAVKAENGPQKIHRRPRP